ncbi:DUF6440 family protein [Dermacoccus barathri]|uniref:DUF6440 family protein n=1 Tax=Dermacoccus barathri TaxID=322601 RepID=UPI0039EBBB07
MRGACRGQPGERNGFWRPTRGPGTSTRPQRTAARHASPEGTAQTQDSALGRSGFHLAQDFPRRPVKHMADEKRFEVMHEQRSEFAETVRVLRDNETGVCYLQTWPGASGGVTLWVDRTVGRSRHDHLGCLVQNDAPGKRVISRAPAGEHGEPIMAGIWLPR